MRPDLRDEDSLIADEATMAFHHGVESAVSTRPAQRCDGLAWAPRSLEGFEITVREPRRSLRVRLDGHHESASRRRCGPRAAARAI